jgi:hypothetical protein
MRSRIVRAENVAVNHHDAITLHNAVAFPADDAESRDLHVPSYRTALIVARIRVCRFTCRIL